MEKLHMPILNGEKMEEYPNFKDIFFKSYDEAKEYTGNKEDEEVDEKNRLSKLRKHKGNLEAQYAQAEEELEAVKKIQKRNKEKENEEENDR